MDFIVSKAEFKSSISRARKALSTVVIQEERGHLLFNVIGNDIYISGTNSDLKSQCIVAINNISNKNYSFTADPKVLEKLIGKVDTDDVSISYDADSYTLKIYTTENKKSYGTLQSFPPDKMITFEDPNKEEYEEYPVKKDVLLYAVRYASSFLSDKKDDQKHFDFINISKGIVYAANGSNKLGLIVFQNLANVPCLKIRKLIVSPFLNFIDSLGDDQEVILIQNDRSVGVKSTDRRKYFSFLKSNIETPPIPKEYLKSEGPYTLLDKNKFVRMAERAIITNNSTSIVGLNLKLSGKESDSSLELKLLANKEAIETIPCNRVNDGEDDVTHVVDFRLLRAVLNSFNTDSEVRLHINDDGKAFKVYCKGEVNNEKFILAGVGAYAKVVR